MLFCSVVLLPGPTALSGLSCIYLALSWLYLLREPKALQEAFNGGGSGGASRMRMVATATSVISVLQLFLSIFFVWQAINIGSNAIPPPQRSSIRFTMPTVPGIIGVRAQTFFLDSPTNFVLNINNFVTSGTFANAGGGGATTNFSPVFLGSQFYGIVNCIAASDAMADNFRVRFCSPISAPPQFGSHILPFPSLLALSPTSPKRSFWLLAWIPGSFSTMSCAAV